MDMQTIEYAIRYCVSRNSYAFEDGLNLAEHFWDVLSEATKRDVLYGVRHNEPSDLTRWPTIAAARNPQGGAR
jgi:hypothetical protein